jgi:DNA ligase (NAD+)
LVNNLADTYRLQKEDLLKLERFAEISATNLISSIADRKRPPLARLVYGLGIRHVGAQTAINLCERFSSLAGLSNAALDELREVEGVGEIVAESIIAWFSDPDNQKLLEEFEKLDIKPVYKAIKRGRLHGMSFVITGSLQTMGRDMAAEKIRALGGRFQTSIAKDTNYLIVGQNVGSSKLAAAGKSGIKQLSENELIKLLDNK